MNSQRGQKNLWLQSGAQPGKCCSASRQTFPSSSVGSAGSQVRPTVTYFKKGFPECGRSIVTDVSLDCLHCCFSKFDIAEWQDELQKPAWLTHTMNRTTCTCLEQAVTHSRVYSNYIVLVEFDVHLRVMRQPVKQCC